MKNITIIQQNTLLEELTDAVTFEVVYQDDLVKIKDTLVATCYFDNVWNVETIDRASQNEITIEYLANNMPKPSISDVAKSIESLTSKDKRPFLKLENLSINAPIFREIGKIVEYPFSCVYHQSGILKYSAEGKYIYQWKSGKWDSITKIELKNGSVSAPELSEDQVRKMLSKKYDCKEEMIKDIVIENPVTRDYDILYSFQFTYNQPLVNSTYSSTFTYAPTSDNMDLLNNYSTINSILIHVDATGMKGEWKGLIKDKYGKIYDPLILKIEDVDEIVFSGKLISTSSHDVYDYSGKQSVETGTAEIPISGQIDPRSNQIILDRFDIIKDTAYAIPWDLNSSCSIIFDHETKTITITSKYFDGTHILKKQ